MAFKTVSKTKLIDMNQDTNLLIQYIVVGGILIAASVWVIVRLIKARRQMKERGGSGSCSCCELSSSCKKSTVANKKSQTRT